MRQIGLGIYLMDDEWANFPGPKAISVLIEESSNLRKRMRAATLFIDFSVRYNAWCGVAWPQLIEEMRKFKKGEFPLISQSLELMILEGLLKIVPEPYHKKWYLRWMNVFSTRVVCPTKFLLESIQKKNL